MSIFTRIRHASTRRQTASGNLAASGQPWRGPVDNAPRDTGPADDMPGDTGPADTGAGSGCMPDDDASATAAGGDPVADGAAGGDASDEAAAGPGTSGDRAGTRSVWRRAAAQVITGLAVVLVFCALVGPNQLALLTPGAFVRIPMEGLVGVAVLLVLPPRARRVAAVLAGAALGLLTLVKVVDMGFYDVLDRPFDLVLDWILFGNAVDFLGKSVGRVVAIGAVVAAVLLVVAVLAFMTLSVRRLTRIVVRHRTNTIRVVAVLAVGWVVCAISGVQIVAGVPVASKSAAALVGDRVGAVHRGLLDEQAFRAEAARDAFAATPSEQLLTALRGKDVMITFVESYGVVALQDPQVNAVLNAGTQQLDAAGFRSRSAYLTSPTFGGASWLAQSTLLSGLWIDNQQRYRNLVTSDRMSLNAAFHRAHWRTVGVQPAVNRAWPEGGYYGFDQLYTSLNTAYKGPTFSFSSLPDQYSLSAFQADERAKTPHAPVMADIALLSSHAPWVPLPRMVDWNSVGDGTVYTGMPAQGTQPDVAWRDRSGIRAAYLHSIQYSLSALISYLKTYGDDNLVVVFLGDHQPAPIVTGDGASHDVPITIVARDQSVLDRISGWGWTAGLKPGLAAPVWRMDSFRDRFLTAFGPPGRPTG
ncbi:MAG: hypothetical protein QOE03_1812 [Micromonosporaceae bacterium]|nr:hypothetical protein [Micromonosporaceae bacterium]